MPPSHSNSHTQPHLDIMLVQCNYTPRLPKNDKILTEPHYWIFIGRLRTCQDCSILAWGGHAIKGDESRKCPASDCPKKPLPFNSSRMVPVKTGHMLQLIHTRKQACLHKCIRTYNTGNPHIPILTPPTPLLQKADTIYMSWREVTGSNQPGE